MSLARQDTRARLLMSTPGVGVIVALTYTAAIDDPARFRSSNAEGSYFGLAPKKYQSGRYRDNELQGTRLSYPIDIPSPAEALPKKS